MKQHSFLCGVTALLLAPALTTSLLKASWQGDTGTALQVPKFDAVSVKPCDPNTAGGGRGGAPAPASPVHFHSGCWSVGVLITMAYVTFAGGRVNPPSARPAYDGTAAPDWIQTERFMIEATAVAATPVPVMHGPMLQAVLEDRFKLKMRRETRDVPVFEVVVAKGGSKLTPSKPGVCVPQPGPLYALPPLESGQHWCNGQPGIQNSDGSRTQTVEALTLDDWLAAIPRVNGRPLVNKTGITGLQTFRFVWSPGPGVGPEFATEIKQLGLELRAAQGPREFLILDHVERPAPDGPVVAPAHARGPAR